MADRYQREHDDRELDPPHVAGRCDDCGSLMTVRQDRLDELDEEEPLRCARCAEEVQAARQVVLAWLPVSSTRH